MENEIETSKNSVDQTFTGENKNKQKHKQNFLPFSKFMCFLNRIFPGLCVNFLVLLSHIPYKKSEELPLARLFDVFTWLCLVMVIHAHFLHQKL